MGSFLLVSAAVLSGLFGVGLLAQRLLLHRSLKKLHRQDREDVYTSLHNDTDSPEGKYHD